MVQLADKEWSSRLGVGWGDKNPSMLKTSLTISIG
jgi:hypothetical protein